MEHKKKHARSKSGSNKAELNKADLMVWRAAGGWLQYCKHACIFDVASLVQDMRVIQRDLVYAVGLCPNVCDDEVRA